MSSDQDAARRAGWVAVVAMLASVLAVVEAPAGSAEGAVGAEEVAAPAWTSTGAVQPGAPGAPEAVHRFADVACAPDGSCMAVGRSDVDPLGWPYLDPPLVEVFDGTSWTVIDAPTHTMADRGMSLRRVECWSADHCQVVAEWTDSLGDPYDFIFLWDGSAWQAPTPAGEFGWPYQVDSFSEYDIWSCSSAFTCFSMGRTGSGTLGYLFEDFGYELISVPPTSLAAGVRDGDVRCVDADPHAVCVFAGRGGIDRWDGTAWSDPAPFEDAEGEPVASVALDCVDAASCVVAGHLAGDPVAATWQGGAVGGLEPITGLDEVTGLACWSATGCMAWGTTAGTAAASVRDTGGWTATAAPPASIGALTAVACGPERCVAVGDASDALRTGSYDLANDRWTPVVAPPPVPADGPVPAPSLLDVSCTAPDACLAGGVWTEHDGGAAPLLQSWDGEAWSMLPPYPAPGHWDGGIEYVSSSCGAADSCMVLAVANFDDDNAYRALHWDGTAWSDSGLDEGGRLSGSQDTMDCVGSSCVISFDLDEGFVEVTPTGSPWRSGAVQTNPVDLSCTSHLTCVVLTRFSDAGVANQVGYLDDGTYTNPDELPISFEGEAISCTADRECLAVGADAGAPAMWRLADSGWVELDPPLAGDGVLADVSCAAVDECVAVGTADGVPVTVLWNGTGWQVLEGGLPGAEDVAFASIDCLPGWCGGVGTSPTAPTATVVAAELAWDPTALPGTPTPSFPDVGPDHRFATEIEWLVDQGAASGYPDGEFKPTAWVSRQAMAAFLFRLATGEASAPACTAAPFPDVDVDHRFCGEITWMVDEGLTGGYPDGEFKPTAPVSRQAAAAYLARWLDAVTPACTAAPFPDVATEHRFCAEIQWLVTEEIADGYPDGEFEPTTPVSRQAAAAFLYRAVP